MSQSVEDRSGALYDLMGRAGYHRSTMWTADAQTEDYLLAQNKLWIITGEVPPSLRDQSRCLPSRSRPCRLSWNSPIPDDPRPATGLLYPGWPDRRLNAGAGGRFSAPSPGTSKPIWLSPPGDQTGRAAWARSSPGSAGMRRDVLGEQGRSCWASGRQTPEHVGGDQLPRQADAALRLPLGSAHH